MAAQALSYEIDIQKFNFIIPIPGSSKTSVHAAIFSEIVSEIIKKPVLDILEKFNEPCAHQEQKTKTKGQRAQARFRVREQFTNRLKILDIKEMNLLVVDDIITTGSSYMQALQALGPPHGSTLLTLFSRASL